MTATKAFNEKGFGAVNLKELAQRMGISRGNLTYHFKDKKSLLEAIVNEMWSKIRTEQSRTRQAMSFQNLRSQTRLYYAFQKEYAFIFLDSHVSNHPIVKKQFRAMVEQSIDDFMAIIAYGIQVGNLKQELIPGTYKSLAFTVWMVGYYWLSQQIIRGQKTVDDAEKVVWSLVLPHMTDKGIDGFNHHYGADFINQLGDRFDVDQHLLITF